MYVQQETIHVEDHRMTNREIAEDFGIQLWINSLTIADEKSLPLNLCHKLIIKRAKEPNFVKNI